MGGFHIRAAAVFRFIDAVWEKPVSTDSIHLCIKQHNKLIWKEDNYAVILEQAGINELDLRVESEIYQSIALHFELQTGQPPLIHTIWMTPSEKYPFTPDMAVIKGKSRSRELYAVRFADNLPFKLMEDIDAGKNKIKLWGIDGTPEEKQFLLQEDKQEEIITISEPDNGADYSYFIKGCTSKPFHKGRAKPYPITKITTDNDGRFVMAYRNVAKSGEKIELICGKKKKIQMEIAVGREFTVSMDTER